jgi:hypothetical protein
MNKGTDQNIMTQLGITSNEYNLVTVLYYVSVESKVVRCCCWVLTIGLSDPIHCFGSTLEFATQKIFSFKMAVKNYAQLGYSSYV